MGALNTLSKYFQSEIFIDICIKNKALLIIVIIGLIIKGENMKKILIIGMICVTVNELNCSFGTMTNADVRASIECSKYANSDSLESRQATREIAAAKQKYQEDLDENFISEQSYEVVYEIQRRNHMGINSEERLIGTEDKHRIEAILKEDGKIRRAIARNNLSEIGNLINLKRSLIAMSMEELLQFRDAVELAESQSLAK